MAATFPRPAFTKHEKRRRDPFASASATRAAAEASA